jgi:hypothetical protein
MFSFIECFYDSTICYKKEDTCDDYKDSTRCNSPGNPDGMRFFC